MLTRDAPRPVLWEGPPALRDRADHGQMGQTELEQRHGPRARSAREAERERERERMQLIIERDKVLVPMLAGTRNAHAGRWGHSETRTWTKGEGVTGGESARAGERQRERESTSRLASDVAGHGIASSTARGTQRSGGCAAMPPTPEHWRGVRAEAKRARAEARKRGDRGGMSRRPGAANMRVPCMPTSNPRVLSGLGAQCCLVLASGPW